MRAALILALVAMTGLYVQSVGVMAWRNSDAARTQSQLRHCQLLRRDAEALIRQGQPPLLGWENFQRKRPA